MYCVNVTFSPCNYCNVFFTTSLLSRPTKGYMLLEFEMQKNIHVTTRSRSIINIKIESGLKTNARYLNSNKLGLT